MLKPTRRVNRARRATPETLPAPIGGLNGRDGLASMPPLDAFMLDNWFPNSTTVDTRNGSLNFATGIPNAVESLEVYTGAGGSRLLAFGDGKVYNCTAGGAVGAAIASGKTSNKISSTMFSNAGAQFLIGLTGADAPFSYNSSAGYATLTITGLNGGVSQNTLQAIHSFKGRLYLAAVELGFYYLAVGAIQGAASYFDLSQQCSKGGYIVGISSFSQESGAGPQDYIVFMTSEGEYLMYAGTDPSNAATFALVGVYHAAPPIGRKGWFKYRSDLYIINVEGVVAFTQIRQMGDDGASVEYLTAKLGRAYTDLKDFKATHGWSAVLYPRGGMVLVNAPATASESGGYYQFAMNTTTNAFGRFVGWNAICWAIFNDRIYFGTKDGKVVLADEGFTDNGSDIRCDARQAYNYFDDGRGSGEADKQFHWATFVVQADGSPPVNAQLCVNFEDDPPSYQGSLVGTSSSLWDVATWDVDSWGGDTFTQNFTVPIGKIGYAASVWFRTSIAATRIRWFATRIVYEKTNGIVLL